MTWLQQIRRALYPYTSRFIIRAILVSGTLKGTDQSFRCLLIGNSKFTEYLIPRMFEGPLLDKRSWKCWMPSLKKLLQTPPPGVDLCIAVLPKQYDATLEGLYTAKCQEYVRQVIDTSGSWEQIAQNCSKSRKVMFRKLSSDPTLSYRTSNTNEDFDFFYHRMHVPFVTRRFGESASTDTYDEMKQYFNKGFLLLVNQDGQAVIGALCIIERDKLIFRRTGVLDGDDCYVKGGAHASLYYCLIRVAKERGCRSLDVMNSRPFINDGVYKNKRRWGAVALPDEELKTSVYFFNVSRSRKVAQFFENDPIVIQAKAMLRCMTGNAREAIDGASVTQDAIEELLRQCQSPGINGVTVVMADGELVEYDHAPTILTCGEQHGIEDEVPRLSVDDK
jgi:hypothetical protein